MVNVSEVPADKHIANDDEILSDLTSRLLAAAHHIIDVRKRQLVVDTLKMILDTYLEVSGSASKANVPIGMVKSRRGRPRKSTDGPAAVDKESAPV